MPGALVTQQHTGQGGNSGCIMTQSQQQESLGYVGENMEIYQHTETRWTKNMRYYHHSCIANQHKQ